MGGIIVFPEDNSEANKPYDFLTLRISEDIYDDFGRTNRRIDNFLYNCYFKISQLNSIHSILSTTRGSEYFLQYLLYHEKLLISYEGDMESENSKIQTAFRILSQVEDLEGLCLVNCIDADREFCRTILELFPSFLDSDIYRRWRKHEQDDAMLIYNNPDFRLTTTIPDIVDEAEAGSSRLVVAKATIGVSLGFKQVDDVDIIDEFASNTEQSQICVGVPLNCDSSSYPSGVSAANSVIKVMDRGEIDDIMKCNGWLFCLLCSMENAPISFFVSSANPRTRGYPIVYANRQFEVTTGYKRKDVIGRSTRYFQQFSSYSTSGTSLDELQQAVQTGRISSAEFIDYKPNGEPYSMLLVVKPLFNMKGNYRYILAIQHSDVNLMRFAKAFTLTRMWMEAIPENISMEEDELTET